MSGGLGGTLSDGRSYNVVGQWQPRLLMNLIKTEIDGHADTTQNGTALAVHCTALFVEKRFIA